MEASTCMGAWCEHNMRNVTYHRIECIEFSLAVPYSTYNSGRGDDTSIDRGCAREQVADPRPLCRLEKTIGSFSACGLRYHLGRSPEGWQGGGEILQKNQLSESGDFLMHCFMKRLILLQIVTRGPGRGVLCNSRHFHGSGGWNG